MLGLELVVAVGVAILVGGVVAQRIHLPTPVVLVGVGSLLTLVPQLHGVGLPPEMVLLLFLPALLYWESLTTSLREIRRFVRGVLLTGVVLVVLTAAAVATVLHTLGVDWGVGWIIGAALAPTDATAVAALARGMRHRERVILEAEGLINDGTALVVYAMAVGLVTGATQVSAGVVSARFALSFGGGIVIGLVVGWLIWQVRRRLRDTMLPNVTSVLTPFVVYLVAEQVHASGVLAVVVCGIFMSQLAPRWVRAEIRMQGSAFWTLTTFLLNGALFVLVGLQLPASVRDLATDTVGHAVVLVVAAYLTLLVVRLAFLVVSAYLIRMVDRRPAQRALRTTNRGRVVSTVAGFRGGVSLALALAVPTTVAGAAFPGRDLIILVTGSVVVLTLVIQGLALPRVIAWAHLPEDTTPQEELQLAREHATREALGATRPGPGAWHPGRCG